MASRSKRDYVCFIEDKCPICGKEFFPTDGWVYNNGQYSHGKLKRVCSWNCHNESRRRLEAKKTSTRYYRSNIIPPGRDEEIRKLASEGVSTCELSEKYSLTADRIRQIIRAGKSAE